MSKTKLLRLIGCLLLIPGVMGAQMLTSSSTDSKAEAAEMTGTIKDYSAGNTLVVETLAPNPPMQFKLARNVTYGGARRIVSDFPAIAVRASGAAVVAEGTLNGGGPLVRISGSGGTIFIRRQEK